MTRNGKDDWHVKTLCEAPFVHRFGIFQRAGVNYLLVGWRQGTRCAIAITWDAEAGNYRAECFDTAAGMANAMHFVRSDGKDIVVGTNREIDELAYYVFTE